MLQTLTATSEPLFYFQHEPVTSAAGPSYKIVELYMRTTKTLRKPRTRNQARIKMETTIPHAIDTGVRLVVKLAGLSAKSGTRAIQN